MVSMSPTLMLLEGDTAIDAGAVTGLRLSQQIPNPRVPAIRLGGLKPSPSDSTMRLPNSPAVPAASGDTWPHVSPSSTVAHAPDCVPTIACFGPNWPPSVGASRNASLPPAGARPPSACVHVMPPS